MRRIVVPEMVRRLPRPCRVSPPSFEMQASCDKRQFHTTPRFAKASSSSSSLQNAETAADGSSSSSPTLVQHFIKTRLSAGEWDPDDVHFTNPLYRPQFKSSARIIAADDFAARPTVGFTGEFKSLTDAMVTLSWLNQTDQGQIYKLYCDMMLSAESSNAGASGKNSNNTTSHEYVMRVIAQQYNITAERVAAVVQLQHNEEQIRIQHPERQLLTETAHKMDTLIQQEINDAYETFKLKPPSLNEAFVEDPVGVNSLQDRKQWTIAEDVYDVDAMSQAALARLDQKARRIIDGHVYIEDVDDASIPVPMDHDCRQLLQQRDRVGRDLAQQERIVHDQRTKQTAVEPQWRSRGPTVVAAPATAAEDSAEDEDGAQGETAEPVAEPLKPRPRWKFIAQTVNTRLLKKQKKKHRSYINDSAHNTIVEQDGTLRNGTMADLKTVAWKLQRHTQEHIYAGAKQGWLDRVNNRKGTANKQPWGKAPPVSATATVAATTAAAAAPTDSESDEALSVGDADAVNDEDNVADEEPVAVHDGVDDATDAAVEDVKPPKE